jgi:hypothetical protein
MTAVGAAIDYSSANKIRSSMQVALDSAMLAGAKDGSSNWAQVALDVFSANVAKQASTGITFAKLFAKPRLGLSRSCFGIRADVISWIGSHTLFARRCDDDCG